MRSRYRIKKVFTSLLWSYMIMIALPSVFTFLMYRQSLDLSTESCVNESLVVLRQAISSFDERLDLMDKASMMMLYDMGIKAMMNYEKPQPGDTSIYNFMKFSDRLSDRLALASDDITGYRIFFRNNELVFYNNVMTTNLEFYYNKAMKYEAMDYETWYDTMFSATTRTLLPASKIKMAASTVEAITYIYPISKTFSGENGGFVHFLIPNSYLEGITNFSNIGSEGIFYLLDSNGTVLSTLGTSEGQSLDYSRITGNEGYYHVNHNGSKHIVIYTRSQQSNLIFAVSLPDSVVMSKAISTRRLALTAIIVSILVELLLCFSFSRKNATPIHNFVKNLRMLIKDDLHKPARVNEYDYLEHSINHFISNTQSMHTALEEKRSLERKMLLDQLIEGRFSDNYQFWGVASEIGLNLEAGEYGMAVFEEKVDTLEILSFLEQKGNLPFDRDSVLYHRFEPGFLIALFCFQIKNTAENQQAMLSNIKHINDLIHENYGFFCSAGAGKLYEDIGDIGFSYKQAKYCAGLQSDARTDYILAYDNISSSQNAFYFPQKVENKLVNSAVHWEAKVIEEAFRELEEENLIKRQLSKPMEEILTNDIMAALLRVYENTAFSDLDPLDAFERIRKGKNLAEVLSAIKNEFLLLGQREEKQQDRYSHFKAQMEDYLQENFSNPMLGMGVAAAHFNFSESYFSQLFKEVMGDSFSTCLENLRLLKAKELIAQGGIEIEQIAQSVGYNNSTTFRRAFKRSEGVSPTKYKANP